MRTLLLIQLCFYTVGLAGLVREDLRNNRAINVITLFLVLNSASVMGLLRYLFSNTDARWKRE